MPDDRRRTIASRSRLSPDEIARRTFAVSRRGFDPVEVRAFLDLVGGELQAAAERERDLIDDLSAAEDRAANPVLDESTLTTALGQETAKVLRSAHDAAAEILSRAESEAGRLRAEAQEESEQVRSHAEQHAAERAAQADVAAADARRRAQEEATARVESAKAEAEALVSQARAECRAMVQEAQELRARVLSDLTRRRRVLHIQIEQLRAGRERLAETISDVRHTVDQVTDDLFRAEDEARLAAEVAGRQVASQEEIDDVLGRLPVPDTAEEQTPAPAGDLMEHESQDDGLTALDEERRQQTVEELFARLRAEQAPSSGGAFTVLGPAPSADALGDAAEPSGGGAPVTVVDEPRAEEAEVDVVSDPALARRDELLGPSTAALARRLKRALADDQNDILDRLRAGGGGIGDALEDEEEHELRYRDVATVQLREAARAGALFAGGAGEQVPSIEGSAAELSRNIVAPLRRRLLEEGSAAEGDEAAMIERVGSAFREWKGQRIERVAADHAHAAFAEAALAVTPKSEHLRWVVDDEGAQCPDCDDNALAGSLPRGETFPTGHVHPPAHPGCRCLLVPDQA